MITQGTWTVWGSDQAPISIRSSVRGRGMVTICDFRFDPESPDDMHDNAALISASPELLKACKDLMKDADNGSARFDDPEPGGVYMRAFEAIDKAENK